MTAATRLVLGVAGVVATAGLVRRDRVGAREQRFFRAVNQLPDGLYAPVWVVMQGGALGAAPAAAMAARAAGRPELAAHLLAGGSTAWAMSKVVKRFVQRPRPVVLMPDTCCRGQDARGLGYVSGHAAVVVALASAALPHLGPRGRVAAAAMVPAVGLARMYVGAHLPLDVVGGAALGLAVDAAVALAVAGPSTLADGARDRENRGRAGGHRERTCDPDRGADQALRRRRGAGPPRPRRRAG